MDQIGKTNSSVILCDFCEKRISIRGIHLEGITQGEYSVSYFSCPHCGKRFHVGTTDERQRALILERDKSMRQTTAAIKNHFREKTIRAHRRQTEKLEKKIRSRAPELKEIGMKILAEAGKEDADGAENGGGGAESL